MPKQVLPDRDDFVKISCTLERWDFRELSGVEFHNQFRRLNLKTPRPRPGRETGFIFYANGLTTVVWTTWRKEEGLARPKDAAWILIIEGDQPRYFSHPIHRTKNFVKNLLNQAWIARWRVLHRPFCPTCRAFMKIACGRGIKSRYWYCPKDKQCLDWDYGLPPKARNYLKNLRRTRARWLAKRRAEGKPTHLAIITRKPWRRVK